MQNRKLKRFGIYNLVFVSPPAKACFALRAGDFGFLISNL